MSVTLRTDANSLPYVGKPRADDEVEILVRQAPEFTAALAYDGSTTNVTAGNYVEYDVSTALVGATSISVSVVEMTQDYEVIVLTKPHADAVLFEEAKLTGTAMAGASIASARFGFDFTGPIGPIVYVRVKNTSGSSATLKGVYVAGR